MPEKKADPAQSGPPPASGRTLAIPSAAAGEDHNHLAPGTRLGEFEILELIGEGGFGIVYLAYDHSLQRKVALKEYMPVQLAARAADASVSVRAEKFTETFEMGRRSFVNEARLLAQFDQPALVKVHRFWEANGTAYMAMPFYEGITLREARKRMPEAPDVVWIRRMLAPVMDALELIHSQQCFHRDIAPDNIMLLGGERPVLLDFGAARKVIGDATQALTVILKPGYAPIEQYAEVPGMRQGAWTDVYALAAVIHFLVTGETPPVAVGRIVHDEYRPLAERCSDRYPSGFLQAVDRCLAVRPEARPQSIAEARALLGFGDALFSAPAAPPKPAPAAVRPAASTDLAREDSAASHSLRNLALILGIALLAGGGAVALWLTLSGPDKAAPPPPVAIPAPVEAPPAPPEPAAAPAEAATVAEPAVRAPLPAVAVGQAFATVAERGDPALAPPLDAVRAIAGGDGQVLAMTAGVPRRGYVYVMVIDRAREELALVFPNAQDADNALAPPQRLMLPRPGWSLSLGGEARQIELLTLFSESPREFPGLAWEASSPYSGVPLARLAEALAAGEGIAPLTGMPRCAGDPCAKGFGASYARIEIPAVAVRARPEPPPTAATSPSEPAQADAAEAARLKAEQEYMRKLNRDLDKLLGEPAR